MATKPPTRLEIFVGDSAGIFDGGKNLPLMGFFNFFAGSFHGDIFEKTWEFGFLGRFIGFDGNQCEIEWD